MPRTLAENATYIKDTIKPAIKSAIEAQGVTVPSTDSFLDYADRIAEIEGGGSGYQLKDLPTGSISTVSDAEALPLNALKVSVEAWQEGSGDPSPSNIRPIIGWDSGEITVDGKNLWDYSQKDASKGFLDNTYLASNGNIESSGNWEISEYIEIPNKTNYLKINKISYGSDPSICFYDDFKNYISGESYSGNANRIYTIPDGASYFRFSLQKFNETITTIIPNTTDVTLNFPQTVYGAEWDVVDGVLSQTDGYIASYNGESLPSSWISDRDVYDGTNTPTIGAEVVYKLATPTTINLSPLSIRLFENTNNIYADCGEVIEGEYFVGSSGAYDLYDYIQTDGTQCIDLGVKVNSGDVINCMYTPLTGMTNWNWLWIAEDTNTSKFSGVVFMSSTQMADYDYSVEANRRNWAADQINISNFTASNNINANIKFSDGAIVKLYSFSINGDDYLPCKRRSDGKFGLYDVKNSTFLTDSASGNAFVGGNNLGVRIG